MKSILNYIMITGMTILVISCATPEDPTPTKMAYGDWEVNETFVNGQANPGTIFKRFTLERDQSYVLVDDNDFISVGEWIATETNLTLTEAGAGSDSTAADGAVYDFSIVFQSYEKMQLLQTIASPSAGDIEIRYFMNRDGSGIQY